jgi:hypothetical protein
VIGRLCELRIFARSTPKKRLRGNVSRSWKKRQTTSKNACTMSCIEAGEHTPGPSASDETKGVRHVIRPSPTLFANGHMPAHGTRGQERAAGYILDLDIDIALLSNFCHRPTLASCSVLLLAPPDAIPGSTLPSPRNV